MLIVAVDTSGRKGSVALARAEGDNFEVLQLSFLEGGMYSAQLLPQISGALEQSHFRKTQVDGFIVVSGPGSFTGLRVGLATLKGLCETLQKPMVAISMLQALALTYGQADESVTALLDAGRDELYVGEYKLEGGQAEMVRESIAKLAEFAEQVKAHSQTMPITGRILTSDPKIAAALRAAGADVSVVDALHADQIGRLGIRKLLAGEVDDPASIDVNYIRRSDAELFATPER